MRCKEKMGKGRCIVAVDADGGHADGIPTHWNGPSHWDKGTWVRG